VVAGHLANAAVTSDVTDSPSVSKYIPIIIGLLAANLVVVLLLAFVSVMSFVRSSRRVGATRSGGVHYVPAKVKDNSLLRTSFAEDKPYSDR
jgi:cadmium resistance protein CadD (predicted permease)